MVPRRPLRAAALSAALAAGPLALAGCYGGPSDPVPQMLPPTKWKTDAYVETDTPPGKAEFIKQTDPTRSLAPAADTKAMTPQPDPGRSSLPLHPAPEKKHD